MSSFCTIVFNTMFHLSSTNDVIRSIEAVSFCFPNLVLVLCILKRMAHAVGTDMYLEGEFRTTESASDLVRLSHFSYKSVRECLITSLRFIEDALALCYLACQVFRVAHEVFSNKTAVSNSVTYL
jgi:hypothetical protein